MVHGASGDVASSDIKSTVYTMTDVGVPGVKVTKTFTRFKDFVEACSDVIDGWGAWEDEDAEEDAGSDISVVRSIHARLIGTMHLVDKDNVVSLKEDLLELNRIFSSRMNVTLAVEETQDHERAAQRTLIYCIGSVGPESVEKTAARAASYIETLRRSTETPQSETLPATIDVPPVDFTPENTVEHGVKSAFGLEEALAELEKTKKSLAKCIHRVTLLKKRLKIVKRTAFLKNGAVVSIKSLSSAEANRCHLEVQSYKVSENSLELHGTICESGEKFHIHLGE